MSLKQIAELTGASVSTVSRILNHPNYVGNDPATGRENMGDRTKTEICAEFQRTGIAEGHAAPGRAVYCGSFSGQVPVSG